MNHGEGIESKGTGMASHARPLIGTFGLTRYRMDPKNGLDHHPSCEASMIPAAARDP